MDWKGMSGGMKRRTGLVATLLANPERVLLDEPTNHLDILSIGWLESYLQKFDGVVVIISHDRFFLDNVTQRTLEISMQKVFDFPYGYTKYKTLREEEMGRLEQAKIQQEKEEYKYAFNKLSNEEKKIINDVEIKINNAKIEEKKHIEDNKKIIHNAEIMERALCMHYVL